MSLHHATYAQYISKKHIFVGSYRYTEGYENIGLLLFNRRVFSNTRKNFVRCRRDQHVHDCRRYRAAELSVSNQSDIHPFRLSGMGSHLISSENDIASDVIIGRWAELVGGRARYKMYRAMRVLIPRAHDNKISRGRWPDSLEAKSSDACIFINIKQSLRDNQC